MTRHAAREFFSNAPLPRAAALLAAATLFAVFAAAPADAACSGVQGTLSRPGNAHYVCRASCAVEGGYGYIIRTEYFDGMLPATACMDECTRTPGCRTVSVEYAASKRDGSPGTQTICIMFRETDLKTVDLPPIPRIRGPVVCYRDLSLRHDPRLRIDVDQFRPDQHRPGVPGVPGVSGPKK